MTDLVWIPSTPEPMQGFLRMRCQCGDKFAERDEYERHYHHVHAIGDYQAALREGRGQTQMGVTPEKALALGYYPSELPHSA
jgi:hypothetical protein